MHDMSLLDLLKRCEEHIVKAAKEVALVEEKKTDQIGSLNQSSNC